MKPRDYLLCFSSSLIFGYLAVGIPAQAQIASDNSMSVPTQVIRQSDKLFEIMGGTEAGINLFHSFTEFSVPEGNVARFINNNSGIQNLIGRITGASASEIFGQIEAGGSAPNFNLFLLNPNGIIFGPNASLNLKGSFVATTANVIQFGERGFFSASSPNDPSLLTVQPSAFFFNQVRANSILNQSHHQTETESGDLVPVGLQVPNDKSLILLGGNVTIDRGMLKAPNGRVELGGLAETGTVALNTDGNNLSLSFPDGVVQADVLLNNGARVDVTDRGSGSITINARNITIAGESELTSDTLPDLVSSGSKAGEITLRATEKVTIDNSEIRSFVNKGAIGNSGDISLKAKSLNLVNGAFINTIANGQGDSGNIILDIQDNITLKGRSSHRLSQIVNQVRINGVGNGGNITIKAKSLSLADAASIQTGTIGKGNAGNIVVRVDDFVSLENTTDKTTQIRAVVEAGAIGNGGTIYLQARSLSLTGGSVLAASVFRTDEGRDRPGGRGKGGDIIVNASDSVNISGVGLDGFSSGIFADTQTGAEGEAGKITVNTRAFRIADGAVINSQTNNLSNGGNIIINANTFEAINGGQLITTADNLGNAGSITVKATDHVTLSGSDPTFADRSSEFDPTIVINIGANSGLFARSDSSTAGNVTVNTPQLTVQEGAEVSVSSPEGQAGNLTINANSLFLNQGSFTAETGKSGEEGANIILKISDLFRIENESRISATAKGSADGGNIDIDTPLLIVFPPTGSNGSDIIANAEEGNGGNITINAQGIFGIAERPQIQDNQSNDIDASSQFGASGQVEINNTIDPNQGLIQLPETVVDPNALVAQNPCKRGSESEFVITGRGGLPPSLSEDLSSEATQVGLVEPAPMESRGAREQESREAEDKTSSPSSVPTPIIPARGWVFNEKGEVVLVAYDPTVTGSQRLRKNGEGCTSP
ncbi:MAG: S-layer family protein [Xenococcaceae cyanobacterium MO_207.B15]|nr:S-layer family protein [Xenococcaceae cyanobacterium MO_207.B15]